MKNPALDAALPRDSYQQPALIPASPWLDATAAAQAQINGGPRGKSAHVPLGKWRRRTAALVAVAMPHERRLDHGDFPGAMDPAVICEISRPTPSPSAPWTALGNLSEPAVWTAKKNSHRTPARSGENEEVRMMILMQIPSRFYFILRILSCFVKVGFGRAVSRILSAPCGGENHLSERPIPETCFAFTKRGAGRSSVSYLALHPMGFSVPRRLRFARWALTPPFHPYRRLAPMAV